MATKNEFVNSTIGEGSSFEGKFFISGSLRIDGKFVGEIKTDAEVVVGETGKVKTNIAAKSVVVAGLVVGDITASEEVRLLETAKILGDIETPVLHMEPGVVTQGKVTITGNEKKDVFKSIEETFNLPVKPSKKTSTKKS